MCNSSIITHFLIYIYLILQSCVFLQNAIGIMCIVIGNGPGEKGFNPRSNDTKNSKKVVDSLLFNTQHYKVFIKGKWSNPGKRVTLSLIHRCSSFAFQILNGVWQAWIQIFSSPIPVAKIRLKSPGCPTSWRENSWIHTFPRVSAHREMQTASFRIQTPFPCPISSTITLKPQTPLVSYLIGNHLY